jgi:hypothetical protein
MRLYHNADITDINSIIENGLLPASVTENDNWEQARANNSRDVVYLSCPIGEENSFVNYGIALIEVEVDATENEMADNDANRGKYTEYVADKVLPEQIKAIYIPRQFKQRIADYTKLSDKALRKIVWCDMRAEVYDHCIPNHNGYGGTSVYKPISSEEFERFLKTAPLSVSDFNFFRGETEKREMIDLYNIKYIF